MKAKQNKVPYQDLRLPLALFKASAPGMTDIELIEELKEICGQSPGKAKLSRAQNQAAGNTAPIIGIDKLTHDFVAENRYPYVINLAITLLRNAKKSGQLYDMHLCVENAFQVVHTFTEDQLLRYEFGVASRDYLLGHAKTLMAHHFCKDDKEKQRLFQEAINHFINAVQGFAPEKASFGDLDPLPCYKVVIAVTSIYANQYELGGSTLDAYLEQLHDPSRTHVDDGLRHMEDYMAEMRDTLQIAAGRYYFDSAYWLAKTANRPDISMNAADAAGFIGREDKAYELLGLTYQLAPEILAPEQSKQPDWVVEPVRTVPYLKNAVEKLDEHLRRERKSQ